ncbi:MAG TPA: hypothetical protein VEQ40_05160, partial [Pyrinomonadaceae bacterium]|nr:hypothetical protein [Pyrinomonadaceae bacterium]
MAGKIGIRRALFLSLILVISFSSQALAQKKQQKQQKVLPTGTPVIWRDPGDIRSRDLRYGPGSAELAPVAPFTFIKEETTQTSPKFRVRDARGVQWTVKLGVEAQAETVSTRLVWAMGYFAEESYYLDRVEINNLPRLTRGQEFIENGRWARGARFEPKRPEVVRGQIWDWLQNPFVGQREFDGLKVLMVLLANYDTRLDNNRIIYQKNPETGQMEARYIVTDIGATLGHVGGLGGTRVKNDLEHFKMTKFIVGVQNGVVEFDYNTTPKGAGKFASIFSGGYAKRQANKEKAMRRIPVENARWIGQQLSLLSDEQLRDAFRAAGYDNATTEGFVKTLRQRIDMLAKL